MNSCLVDRAPKWVLKLRCFGFCRTRCSNFEYEYLFTEYRFAEYEYEKPWRTSIETPKHANSATSKIMGDVRLWRIACRHNAGPAELRTAASI